MKNKIGNRKTEKERMRFREFFRKQKEWNELLKRYGSDILASHNFRKTREYIQHGNMTVSSHCINVAIYSLAISKKLNIPCNQRELVRGALLHDYFLYDWHDKYHRDIKRLHGFYHPGIALRNASKEYKLTEREKDIAPMVANGTANKVIAIDLDISENSVKKYRSSILEKLQVRTIVELTDFLRQIGKDSVK